MKTGAWLTADIGGVKLKNFVICWSILTRYLLEHPEEFQDNVLCLPDRWTVWIDGSG